MANTPLAIRHSSSGNVGRRRGRPTVEEVEAITRQILSAAQEVFEQQSFESASVEAIAAQAGVKKNTIYKRFVDKRTLLRAVLIDRLAAWEIEVQPPAPDGNVAQCLKSLAARMLERAISRDIRVWTRLAESAWPGLDELEMRRSAMGYDRVIDLFAKEIGKMVQEDGNEVRNPVQVATALMSILTGWADTRGQSSNISSVEIEHFTNAAVDLIVLGRSAW